MFRLQSLIPLLTLSSAAFAQEAVQQTARDVPVAATVDVVVVGGNSGAVAAAVAAAKSGAKVFLTSSRPYLGEDLAGTLRLALEPGETPEDPLAKSLFVPDAPMLNQGIPFTYEADLPSAVKHKDTKRPSLLNDGQWADAQHESVQYDGDVSIVLDLGKVRELKNVHAMVYQGGDYKVQAMTVALSANKQKWTPAGTVKNPDLFEGGKVVEFMAPFQSQARYVRCRFQKTAQAPRILLGELMVNVEPAPSDRKEALAGSPRQIKRALSEALTTAGVDWLYGCYPSDVLCDAAGKPAGIVMVNRSGRQAILAKVVIDATPNAALARLAGVQFRPLETGPLCVKWIAIARQAKPASAAVSVRKLEMPQCLTRVFHAKRRPATYDPDFGWYEYTFQCSGADGSWNARAELDQKVRDAFYDPSQLYTADEPFFIFPQSMVAEAGDSGEWAGAKNLDLKVFRPAGQSRLWVLGACADVSRAQAERLLRPLALLEAGRRVGAAAAAEAGRTANLQGVQVRRAPAEKTAPIGDVKELLGGLRPQARPRNVPDPAGKLPVVGVDDVVVIGGGTGGSPAGIGAARQGAKTLVVEYLNGLGGVGTLGFIGGFWYGNRVGFTADIPQSPTEVRMQWYRSELRKAKADIWFASLGCGTFVEGNRVKGVVVASPYGRGVVLAGVVVDATGNADTAIAAGAKYEYVQEDFALQSSHLPMRNLGESYVNGNITPIDDTDPLNIRAVIQEKLLSARRGFDIGPHLDTRERRRVVGDFTLDWLDVIIERTFPDSVVRGCSDYDSHGYQIHPYFCLTHVPAKHKYWAYVPYRCLLPQGLEGMLVAAIGLSVHRDALPIVRMQPDQHNLGYAAGVAAAMASRQGVAPRQIDVKELQKHLVEVGNLSKSVLTDRDLFPLSAARIHAAVETVKNAYQGAETLLAQPKDSLPLLRAAYAAAQGHDKIVYAHVMAAAGDPTGVRTLIDAIRADAEVSAKPGKGSGGTCGMLRTIGIVRDRRAVPLLIELLQEKGLAGNFQIVRAVSYTAGRIGDPTLAAPLANLLSQMDSSKTVKPEAKWGQLSPLLVACALYRCGDQKGLGRAWLEKCVAQSNGPLSQMARYTLATGRSPAAGR